MSIQPGAALYTQGFGTRPENVEVPVVTNVAPSSNNVNYPIGKRWINTASNTEYILTSSSMTANVITPVWTLLGTNSGPLNTLSDTANTTITPAAGNIQIAGTASQITSTAGSGAPHFVFTFFDYCSWFSYHYNYTDGRDQCDD